jgi:NADH-quinone oxidoreductase subunit J
VEAVLFFFAAIGALGGAIGVVAMRNPFYGVLALIVHLFSLSVLFLLLTSAFVAAAQVVVYAGAVMVLYVFVVAYVGSGVSESAWEPIPGQRVLAPLLAIALFVELSIAVLGSSLTALDGDGPDVASGFGDPASIGHALLEDFLLPFEASSILLLLAAVGAVVLAAKRAPGTPSSLGDRPGENRLPTSGDGADSAKRSEGAPATRKAGEVSA